MKHFYIHTMGCKSNQFEGAIIEENLTDNGLEKVLQIEDADFYITSEYDNVLKSLYGDYMKLPPEEDRVAGHSQTVKYYWKET